MGKVRWQTNGDDGLMLGYNLRITIEKMKYILSMV